jgi:hypothetical protein
MSWDQDPDIEVACGYEGGVQIQWDYDPGFVIDVPLALDLITVFDSPIAFVE